MSDRHQQLVGQLERLADLTLYDLREEWRRLYRMQPPSRLSRDLLTRGIAYRLQEQAFGGLPKSLLRRLKQASSKDAQDARGTATPLVIKPGTRLVREWRGVTHSVLVQADHVEWNGERYRSLSEVARAITGARWSGPRFFGLRKRSATATVPVGNDARRTSDDDDLTFEKTKLGSEAIGNAGT